MCSKRNPFRSAGSPSDNALIEEDAETVTDNLAAAYDSRSCDDVLTAEAAAAVLLGLKRQQTTSKPTSRRRARPHAQAAAEDAGTLRAFKLHELHSSTFHEHCSSVARLAMRALAKSCALQAVPSP